MEMEKIVARKLTVCVVELLPTPPTRPRPGEMASCVKLALCSALLISMGQTTTSFQSGCPYENWINDHENVMEMEAAASAPAPNALEFADVKHVFGGQRQPVEVVRPVPTIGLSPNSIDDMLKSSFTHKAIGNGRFNERPGEFSSEQDWYKFYLGTKTAELSCALPPLNCANDTANYYYRTFDGSCNNLLHPEYGMAKTRYSRLLRPNYEYRVEKATTKSLAKNSVPNARLVSTSVYGEDTQLDSFRTLIFMQWGQFVSHDISRLLDHNPPENCCDNPKQKLCDPIALYPLGPISMASDKRCLNFVRCLSDDDIPCPKNGLGYPEKITATTAYLDLSSIYGNSLEQNIKIRQYRGGLLKTAWMNGRAFPPVTMNMNGECAASNSKCFALPDDRNQKTPIVAVLHTVLLREHNRLASLLAQLNPHYSDERLFQEARKINIAQYQKITYYDWLPLLLGPTYTYASRLRYYVPSTEYVNDYNEKVNVAPYAAYAAAAFRYAHTQIPGWFSMVSARRDHNQTMRLSDYFERAGNIDLLAEGSNFDCLIRGLVTQLQKRSDSNMDPEIKHHFDRKPLEEFGTDLKSIDIQRGRDFGLPSYNDFRELCGLPRAYSWPELSNEIPKDKIALMQKLYYSPNDVDLSVGGSLEAHATEAIMGPTFQCIMAKQFLKLRRGDRFFFEHEDLFGGFSKKQLAEIRKTSLAGLLCNNGDYMQHIQSNAFVFPNDRNDLVKCASIPQLNLGLWKEQPSF